MRGLSARRRRVWFNVLIALPGLLVGTLVRADDPASEWPQFLGPRRDGTTTEARLIEGWLRAGLHVLWRSPTGAG